MSIAVVVPTIRYENEYQTFLANWKDIFTNYQVVLITIVDGGSHRLIMKDFSEYSEEVDTKVWTKASKELGDLIPHFSPACRNLGFAYIAKILPEVEYIITLDDDLIPLGDTIGAHINALQQRMPISWFSSTVANPMTIKPLYMRGFPYGIRNEAEVVLSHGVWFGVPDLDASTQLVMGDHPEVSYYTGPIPKGCEFPYSSMNLAFKRKALPYIYMAPVSNTKGAERFDDIWAGRFFKKDFDQLNWATVSGYSAVEHNRASNPFKNLQREVLGIEWNEDLWSRQEEEFFKMYAEKRNRWKGLMESWMVK